MTYDGPLRFEVGEDDLKGHRSPLSPVHTAGMWALYQLQIAAKVADK